MDIEGKTAIVTGASRGLGEAVARRLARGGARVVLVARASADLERVTREIRESGGEAWAVAGDIGAKDDVHRISGAAAALAGPASLVVHAAGTLGPVPLVPLLDTACEDLERAFAVNVTGPMRLTKVLAGPMVLAGEGLVVFVSSDAATEPYAGWGAYGASKAAVEQLARIWATELASTGVRVIVVDPGEMDTRMHADAIPDADRATLARPDDVARRLVGLVREVRQLASVARVALASELVP